MKSFGAKIALCVGQSPGLFSDRMLRCQGALLEHDFDFPATAAVLDKPLQAFLNSANERIQADTSRVHA
jgi:hypothetical protein